MYTSDDTIQTIMMMMKTHEDDDGDARVDDMVTIKSHKETTSFTRDQTVQHIDEVYEEMEDIDDKLDRQYKAMLKKRWQVSTLE